MSDDPRTAPSDLPPFMLPDFDGIIDDDFDSILPEFPTNNFGVTDDDDETFH